MAADGNNPVDELAASVRSGDRSASAWAITLVESTRPDVPVVGRSTTSEALGMYLVERGHRVAVLIVDPSSTRTGGSILGDETRMARLAVHPDAYTRSSPTSGTLGCRHHVA